MGDVFKVENFIKKNNGKASTTLVIIIVLFVLIAIGSEPQESDTNITGDIGSTIEKTIQYADKNEKKDEKIDDLESNIADNELVSSAQNNTDMDSQIPEYSGSPYCVINNNVPFFDDTDLVTTSYERYSNLDKSGRCGVTVACIGKDLMPTEERGNIGSIKPTGWHTVKYAGIDGNYLYNRCHLIGFQLTAENANEKNLITGTRYMNVQGMLPFENMVADYIKETNNHVLYRVTPIFNGDNLLASGVLMEAMSVEDNGAGVEFCVYCYNVQPGVTINYKTGESTGPEYTGTTVQNHDVDKTPPVVTPPVADTTEDNKTVTYILNTNSKVFHYPSCGSVEQMKEKNKKQFYGTSTEAINLGYKSCGRCHP